MAGKSQYLLVLQKKGIFAKYIMALHLHFIPILLLPSETSITVIKQIFAW